MPIEKLSASQVCRLLRPGKYSDGGGLYLQVTRRGTKSWVFRYIRQGVERSMGLGALHTVSLNEARSAAHRVRSRLALGFDPIQERLLGGRPKANDKTFDECVAAYITRHCKGWRSVKHAQQWEQSLRDYASPHIGRLHVRSIDTAYVLQALEPIWAARIETASRLRSRIERVLAWATISGYREGDNPARWKGHLQELLPPPAKVREVRHYPSMPYQEIGAFLRQLTTRKGDAARALVFTILTACRSAEAREARWEEIDLGEATWTIPPKRMKAGKVHRVPLTPAMLGILRDQQGRDAAWVFPGKKPGSPLSGDAILAVLRRMGVGVTVHGFRSTFRVWAAECVDCPKEVPELALAHAVGSAVEAAYQRSDLFGRRRALMQAWNDFCMDEKNTNE